MSAMTPTSPAVATGEQVSPQPASATEALYRAALGGARLAHHLPAFARFDELGVARAHWNHAAAWLGWHWLLYHRLWRQALLHGMGVALAVAAWWWLQRVAGPWPDGVRWGLLAAIGAVAVAAPGWWGDAWLHADVRRRMTDAVRRARTVQEACTLLARPSPARRVWMVVLALEVVALVGWRLGGPGGFGGEGVPMPPKPEPVLSQRTLDAPAPVVAAPQPEPEPVAAAPAAPSTNEPAAAAPPALPTPPPTLPVSTAPPVDAQRSDASPPATATATATTEPAASVADAPRPRLGGHGVAVGIFADPANADRAAQRLRNAGLPVVVDPIESARGPLTRVRVGPFATREEAVNASETVRNLGLEARVYGPR